MKLIDLLEETYKHREKIPARIWSNIIFINDDKDVGITRSKKIIYKNPKKGILKDYNWNYFKEEIYPTLPKDLDTRRVEEVLLLAKPKHNLNGYDVINCWNQEVRKLILERLGFNTLITQLEAIIIHDDGESTLIHIPKQILPKNQNEDIRLVRVKDTTSGLYYLLRVPNNIKSCKEAIAWTFSMYPEDYNPIIET